ncbi:DNA polymerase III subunit beta [Hominenteromicrobium sp.]|uniref:DNA polymerase III subunit beta n=1 Tax=Hominenteromicrobium sp. TaxID=3073581 RepID=UPI003AEF7CD2
MKFTVEKRLLNEAVTNLQRAVSSKTSIPALEGILIRSEENRLILTAYDLEIGMQTELPAIISAPGAIILTAKLFAEIVRRSPDEDITIDVDDRNTATITSGVSCFTIIGMDSAEFPELPKITDADTIKMPQELLKSMIRQTLFAVADSTAKPIHQGSLFKIENGNLDVVSVDGYRLALRREAINYANNTEFVVPGKTLSEVLKLLKDSEGEVEICPSRRHILFRIDNYTVISALLEGEFLDYKSALPKDKKTEVTVSTRTMIESVERVSLLITDRLKSPVRCVIGEDTVKLFCTTTMGRATDQISAEISGDQLEIGFNNKYLLDALRAAETDEVRLQLGGPISPMLVLPKEGDAFSFLVLPVRLRNEM